MESFPYDEQGIFQQRVQEAEAERRVMGRYVDDFFQHDAGPQPFADHEGRIISQIVSRLDVQFGKGLFYPCLQFVTVAVGLSYLLGQDEVFRP